MHRTTQKIGRVRAVPRLCGFYPGICLTTEENNGKTLVSLAQMIVKNDYQAYFEEFFPNLSGGNEESHEVPNQNRSQSRYLKPGLF